MKAFLQSAFLAAVLGATAATASAQVYVNFGPPAPVYETRPAYPGAGYGWVPGYYSYNGRKYVWVHGHYAHVPHAGSTWVAGHWVQGGHGRWHWRPGHWT